MFKKSSAFIFAFIAFLAFPLSAFASSDFTVSNYIFHPSNQSFSFDVDTMPSFSNPGHIALGLDTTSHSELYNSIDTTLDALCSGTHCSGTFQHNYPDNGSFNFSDSYVFHFYDYDSTISYFSQEIQFPSVAIVASPSGANVTVGTPFTVDVKVNDTGAAFNAAQATVALSSNLSITGISYPTTNSCNFNYTTRPSTTNASFAGAIFGGSSTGCTAYTLTLTPNATGTGTITFTNGSVKAYSNNAEILTDVQNGSFTISAGPTPTPTAGVPQLTITSPLLTYLTSYTLAGGKDTTISHVFINASESGVTFPTTTTWQAPETLSLGDNNFTIYGTDDSSNQTATQTVDVNRHTLGDINGDGNIDLIDASLFAVDYGKTSNLTYILSDMNGDGSADLTDLSILAKLE